MSALLATLVGDQNAHCRRQVSGTLVQVNGNVVALYGNCTACLQLLTGLCGLLVHDLGDLLAVDLNVVELVSGVGLGLSSSVSNLGCESLESLVLSNEVGLTVDLDHGVARNGDEALGSLTVSALGDVLSALDAQVLNSLVVVAVGLFQSLLAIEHAGAGSFAQCLDVCSSVVRHSWGDPP